jgi:predicted dehydrogenase
MMMLRGTCMPQYPVRAALLGVGAWARVMATAAESSEKIALTCCFGRDPDRTAAFSRETRIPARKTLDSVLEDASIDAVLLALPNDRHLEFARLAAQAGKHVYVEKPVASTLEDGLRVAALESASGIRIVVGHCARLLSGNRLLRQMIDSGQLGHVSQVEANFSNDRGLRLSPRDWRGHSANAPGGALSQIAIHQLDVLRFLGGDIAAVSASAARHSPGGAEVEDQWLITVRFADGKLGAVISSWTSPGTYNVRVTGDAGLAMYEIDPRHWPAPDRLHENATLYVQRRGAGIDARHGIAVPPGNMLREELNLFADCVVLGENCELSAENACQALAAVWASIQSAENQGAAVSLAEVLNTARAKVKAGREQAAGSVKPGGSGFEQDRKSGAP